MVSPDYSLDAAPRQVGRSMSDPRRMQDVAMRRMRSAGDFKGAAELATNQAWLDARLLGRNGAAPMLPAQAQPPAAVAPVAPAAPASEGRLVYGRGGSMVWQPGATAEPMTPPEPPSVVAPPMAASAPAAPEPLQGLNPLTGLPLNMPAPKLPMGTIAANQNGFPGLLQPPDGLYSEPGRNGEPSPVTTVPIAGTNYVMPIADGKPMGTLPVQRPDPQPLPGMVPTAMESNGVRYETPGGKPVKPDISWQEDPKTGAKVPYQTMIDAKGNVTLRRVPIIDANNDGVDDRAQGGGAAAAPAAPRPTSGTLPSGIKFTLK